MNSHRSSAGSAGSGGSEAPEKPERRRVPTRAWLQPALIGLVILAAFIGAYVGLQRNPQPHEIPIAVTGERLARETGEALGPSVRIVRTATPAAARQALESREAVASLTRNPGAGVLHLDVAGANGQSTTAIVTDLVRTYAQQTGQRLTVDDVIPLVKYDSRGLAGFYLSFGVTLAGFVLAQSVLGLRAVLPPGYRFALVTGFSVLAGILAAVLAGPVLHAVPAPVVPLAITLALLTSAAAFTTLLLGTYLGPIGVPVATLLLLTLGNATSGAVIGAGLLPAPARFVSPLLPPGAAVRAVGNLSYFQSTTMLMPMITLVVWSVGAALLVAAQPRLSRAKAQERP